MFEHNPIPIDYQLMPKCVYTYPEIASIGMNDNDATVQDIEFERYTLPLRANGKSNDSVSGQSSWIYRRYSSCR